METVYMNRRSGEDRRSNKVPDIKSLFIYHNRKKSRRKGDANKFAFYDQYSSRIFIAIVSILFLSMIDAFLTLFLIDCGATEINPIMAYYINLGPHAFISAKYIFTSFSLIILLLLSNYHIKKINIHVRSLFHYTAGLFVLVVVWELGLVFRVLY